MADAVFGGGGSVQWALSVDDDERDDPVKRTEHKAKRTRGCTCRGVDKIVDGTYFSVAIRVPHVNSREEFIEWLRNEGQLRFRNGAARFQLPIQEDPNQISVRWR
jgi:hypothetical protein